MRYLFFLLLISYNVSAQQTQPVSTDRPNIIFILTDDMGNGDISYNNNYYHTPRIDQLCTNGIYYNNFYTATNCSPARAALMTGRYPYQFTLNAEVIQDDDFDRALPPEPVLSEKFQQAGYHTAIIGKWHLGNIPMTLPGQRGFSHFYGLTQGNMGYYDHLNNGKQALMENGVPMYKDKDIYATDLFTDKAIEYIRNANNNPCPFFLYLSYTAPHTIHQGEQTCLDTTTWMPSVSTNTADRIERINRYCMMTNLDYNIGRLLDELNSLQIEEETLIVFTSDNGAIIAGVLNNNTTPTVFNSPYRQGKGRLHEGGVHVPMTMWQKGKIEGGENDEFVHMIDFYPTLLGIIGANIEPYIRGIDFSPTFTESPLMKRYLYLDIIHPTNKWGVLDTDTGMKLINNPTAPNRFISPFPNAFELYDIVNDVGETNNLYGTGNPSEIGLLNAYNNEIINVDSTSQLPYNVTGFYKNCAWGLHYKSEATYYWFNQLNNRVFEPN